MEEPIAIDLSPVINLTDEQFYHLAVSQPDPVKLERTPTGEIIVLTSKGAETSNRNIGVAKAPKSYKLAHQGLEFL